MAQAGYTLVTESNSPAAPAPEPTPESAPAPEATPPPATPDNVAPPAPQAAADPTIDENRALSMLFGDRFKTKSEIEAAISERDSAISEANELKQRKPYANEYVEKLNEAVRNGVPVDVFHKVNSVDLSALKPEEALVHKFMWEHGLSKDDAQAYVDATYKIGSDYLDTDPTVRASRIKLQIDGNDAIKYLQQYKVKELAPRIPEAQVAPEQRVNKWNNIINDLVKNASKVNVPVNEKDVVSYELPQEAKQRLIDFAKGIVSYAKEFNDVGADNTAGLMAAIQKEVIQSELNNIIKKAVEAEKQREMQAKIIKDSNPSVLKPGVAPSQQSDNLSNDERIARMYDPAFKMPSYA